MAEQHSFLILDQKGIERLLSAIDAIAHGFYAPTEEDCNNGVRPTLADAVFDLSRSIKSGFYSLGLEGKVDSGGQSRGAIEALSMAIVKAADTIAASLTDTTEPESGT